MRGRPSDSRPSKISRRPISLSERDSILPNDVLIEIFKRLPLESLIRFTCVCKSWYSLLASPTFVSEHVSHNFLKKFDAKSPNCHLFRQRSGLHNSDGSFNFSVFNTNPMSIAKKIESPVCREYFVVSCSDGLLCLFPFFSRNPNKEPLVLWNPSVKRSKTIQVPDKGTVDLTPGAFPKLIFGFGLDTVSNEYKVVRTSYFSGEVSGSGSGVTFLHADVYVLSVGNWRVLDKASVPRNFATIRPRGVCLNGVIHWLCNVNADLDGNSVLKSILTFKLTSEKFGEINLPIEISKAINQTLWLLNVPKSNKEVLGVMQMYDIVLSLWVMEGYGIEESWVKLYNINFSMNGHALNVAVLTEEEVMVQESSRRWISCNVKSGKRKSLSILSDKLEYVGPCVESVILLGGRRSIVSTIQK